MFVLSENDAFYAAWLEEDERELFTDIGNICHEDEKRNPGFQKDSTAKVAQRLQECGDGFWHALFSSPSFVPFGLFMKDGEEGDVIVGKAEIIVPDSTNRFRSPEFCSAYVLSSYRRQSLSHLLHQARRTYLLEFTPYENAQMSVHIKNDASIRAAQANGFEIIHTSKGKKLFVMTANYRDLRERHLKAEPAGISFTPHEPGN